MKQKIPFEHIVGNTHLTDFEEIKESVIENNLKKMPISKKYKLNPRNQKYFPKHKSL